MPRGGIVVGFLVWSVLGVSAVQAQEQVNAGIAENIWFSRNDPVVGETLRVYTAVFNDAGYDISGKIKFLNDGEDIGEVEFTALDGELVKKWVDWEPGVGEYVVGVKIFEGWRHVPGEDPVAIAMQAPKDVLRVVEVDEDTDGDGVGNKVDEDDDNDELLDEEEKEYGTDPLRVDTDGDGIEDHQEYIADVTAREEGGREGSDVGDGQDSGGKRTDVLNAVKILHERASNLQVQLRQMVGRAGEATEQLREKQAAEAGTVWGVVLLGLQMVMWLVEVLLWLPWWGLLILASMFWWWLRWK